MISGSVTIIYATETTTSLRPTIIQDPRQPPPPSSTYTNRNGLHPWQIGLAVALILALLALCFAAVVMIWFRRRRQELRDQEDKIAGSREPWNDPATAAAVMGASSGGGGGGAASAVGIMHTDWHEYNKEANLMAAAAGDSRAMSSMDGGYHHVQHHHLDTRYGPNGELMLIGYADPYGGGSGKDMTDYMGDHSRAFNGSDDYGLGLDYAMGSEIGGGAELASNSGSLAGDHLSYSGSSRYPIPPPLQRQYVSSNHPQESQPVSPVPRVSYEDDYHAAVAHRQQLQQQQQQQQSRVCYPLPPPTATSASRQPSRDELGTTTSGTTEATEEGAADDYRLNLEKYSKVEHRRQSPHALLVLGHPAGNQDGEIGGEAASPSGIVASPLDGPIPNAITGEGKEGAYRRDDLTPEPGSSSGQGGDGDGGGSHERGSSTPGEETAAVRSYLDRLRVDS
ncbi:hypothetical protein KI688_009318 [Linnemannia hyalina]|uniref:Uncharacterized protein n=1 Tax=Linnemannia hyalina TaxID=64524 RepID=A0A9P7Y1B0_9FUNG|nr:hypothetical protein KI688_009318 [Linnemannia hyalina]